MINLLKMDFHRFIRNKIMYVLLLIFALFQAFAIFMMSQYDQPMSASGIEIGSMNASEFIQYVMSQPPSWMLMYITVFTIYFYMSEQNAGYYKNFITMKHARIKSLLSKIMIQGVFTFFMFITMLISDFSGRMLFFGNTTTGNLGYLITLLIGQFLLHWSFSILILATTVLTKKTLISFSIGIVFVLNIIGMIIFNL